jgi:hypothetical protein
MQNICAEIKKIENILSGKTKQINHFFPCFEFDFVKPSWLFYY